MMKRPLKALLSFVMAGAMALSLAVVAAPAKVAVAADTQRRIDTSDVLAAGWRNTAPNLYTQSTTVYLGSLTNGNTPVTIRQPGIPVYDNYDNVTYEVANGIVYSATADAMNGTFTIVPEWDLSNKGGQSVDIEYTMEGIKLDTDPGTASAGKPTYTFVYTIRVVVKAESQADPTSLSEGWVSNDNGRTYTMTYDTFQLGEGLQGTTLPVALPKISTNGYFDNGDVNAGDSNRSSIIKDINIVPGSYMMYITFADNLTPLVGRNTAVVLSEYATNAQGVNAQYTLTIPIRVTNLADATVNGLRGPATIYVNQGDTTGLRVSGIEDPRDAVVHWTTDSSGYVDVNNMNSLPKINSTGVIDTSSMAPGTYYFYVRAGGNLETRTYTVVIKSTAPTKGSKIYRMYNQLDGDHIYTTNYTEVQNLVNDRAQKWMIEPESRENFSAVATDVNAVPVYRMKNIASGEHLFTADTNEKNYQSQRGWIVENNGQPVYYGVKSSNYPVYRLYNPKATNDKQAHLYTMDSREVNVRLGEGWSRDAGVAYYIMN